MTDLAGLTVSLPDPNSWPSDTASRVTLLVGTLRLVGGCMDFLIKSVIREGCDRDRTEHVMRKWDAVRAAIQELNAELEKGAKSL